MKKRKIAQGVIWSAGIPTAPDVDAILEKYRLTCPGDGVRHDQIESLLNIKRNTHRYRSIITAVKRRLERERNLILAAMPGIGFTVLDNNERVDAGSNKMHMAGRAARRAVVLANGATRTELDAEHQAKADHMVVVSATILGALRTQARELNIKLEGLKRLT